MNQPGDRRGGAPPEALAAMNGVFRLLGPRDRAGLLPALSAIHAAPGDVLMEAGDRDAPALFPCGGAVASLGVALPDGGSADVALLGAETLLFTGAGWPAFGRVVVRRSGLFLRLESRLLRAAAAASPTLHDMLARAADSLLADLTQTSACNARHALSQRLCRWLLAMRDRQSDGRISLTQDYLARLLGVQRTTVSTAAAALARAGVIRYARGQIDAPERATLEQAACACHAVVQAHHERLLPGAWLREDAG